ncbi:hypothetical protein [Mucilaginibacter sp.]|uniref:hypothetical protein n=1 Tax=Mucilaginibacter sp. TaxID=1882438 RepID=UPI003262FCFF
MDKLITISFNAENILSKHRQVWKYWYHKNKSSYLIHSALAVFILLGGIHMDDSAPFPTGTLIGAVYCLFVSFTWLIFFQRKKKYFKTVKNYTNRSQQNKLDYNYTFSDFGITYEDDEKSQKVAWSLLKSVVDFNEVLLITNKDTKEVQFSISKKEIGDLEYANLYQLLKQRLA